MKGMAFIGGEAPDPSACKELAKGVDCIVAADSGLMNGGRADLSPDWIVGDMDSLDNVQRLAAYPREHALVYPVDSIVAADSGLMNVERAGLSPDWIVGDMDSLDSVQRLAAYPKEHALA